MINCIFNSHIALGMSKTRSSCSQVPEMNLDMNSDYSGLCTDMLAGYRPFKRHFVTRLSWQNRLIHQVSWFFT